MKTIDLMHYCVPWFRFIASVCLLSTLTAGSAQSAAPCSSQGADAKLGDSYVCGIPSAEDLVHLSDTPWLMASAFAGGAVLNVIDTREKTWQTIVPSENYSERHNKDRFPDCPGPIADQTIVTHGLHLAKERGTAATLYAVSHGSREAIEVFHVKSEGDRLPLVEWVGCVPSPAEQEINSVVSLSNGDLLATVPLETGFQFAQALSGVDTGAVYRWTSRDRRWRRLDATAQPYANGISVSQDETRFYVASSGLRQVIAYSNAPTPRVLGASDTLAILPDNLHRDANGALVTAGLLANYTSCNPYNSQGEFDLTLYGSCPRPYEVVSLDPDTLTVTVVAAGAASSAFSNATTGVKVMDTLWVGSFGADRVAYRVPTSGNGAEYFSLRPAVEKAYGYTHAVRVGQDITISGAVSMDDNGNPTAVGDLAQQMKNVYGDLERVLSHYGLGFEHVIAENVFTTDMAGFVDVSGAFRRDIYNGHFPAGSWLEVQGLALPEFMIEIELEARKP